LSDIYLKLFAVGKLKIEETQLIRGLTERIAKDVTQVIQITNGDVPPNPYSTPIQMGVIAQTPNGTVNTMAPIRPPAGQGAPSSPPLQVGSVAQSAVGTVVTLVPAAIESRDPRSVSSGLGESSSDRTSPKFGLFGTNDCLRLITLQTDPRTVRELTDLSEAVPQPGQTRPAVATELRTIEYTFSASTGYQTDARQRPAGLLRREWAWESWVGLKYASAKPTDDGTYSDMLPDPNAEWTEEDVLAFENGRNILHVPQVVGIEFYYYDGSSWDEEWNSWERGGLPQLVEVVIRIKVKNDDPETKVQETSSGENSDSSTDGELSSAGGNVYRRLIQLPFAKQESEPESDDSRPRPDDVAGTSLFARPRQR
jgi:hypothetical protein